MAITDYVEARASSRVVRRLHGGVIAVVLLLGLVGAVTATDDAGARVVTGTELSLLSSAADKASSVTTARLDLVVDIDVGGQKIKTVMKGALDNDQKRGSFDITVPDAPAGAGLGDGFRLISEGTTLYLSIPEHLRAQTGGKAWASTEATAEQALAATSASATSYLELLQQDAVAGTEVLRIGDEEIRGVRTTHYRATLDFARLAAGSSSPERVQQLAPLGLDEMPLDVHLDGDGVPRKTSARVDGDGISFTFVFELYDLGKPVDVPAAPPAEEAFAVESLQALMALLAPQGSAGAATP